MRQSMTHLSLFHKYVLIYRCFFFLENHHNFTKCCSFNTCLTIFPKTTVISSLNGCFTCENRIQIFKEISRKSMLIPVNVFFYLYFKHIYLLIHLSISFNLSPQTDLCMNFTYCTKKNEINKFTVRRYIFNCVYFYDLWENPVVSASENGIENDEQIQDTIVEGNVCLEFIHKYCKMHDTYFIHAAFSKKRTGISIVIEIFIVLL